MIDKMPGTTRRGHVGALRTRTGLEHPRPFRLAEAPEQKRLSQRELAPSLPRFAVSDVRRDRVKTGQGLHEALLTNGGFVLTGADLEPWYRTRNLHHALATQVAADPIWSNGPLGRLAASAYWGAFPNADRGRSFHCVDGQIWSFIQQHDYSGQARQIMTLFSDPIVSEFPLEVWQNQKSRVDSELEPLFHSAVQLESEMSVLSRDVAAALFSNVVGRRVGDQVPTLDAYLALIRHAPLQGTPTAFYRIPPHVDSHALTFLPPSNVDGLRYYTGEKWESATLDEGIVVLAGSKYQRGKMRVPILDEILGNMGTYHLVHAYPDSPARYSAAYLVGLPF